ELALDDRDLVVGYVGRLVPQKGLRLLLQAFAKTAGPRSDMHLCIVGDGPSRDALAGEAKRLGVDSRTRFMGARKDVAGCLRAMDIFVLPSYREGLPLSLLEAMATRLPVIATRVADNEKIVTHGVDGILVGPGSADELAGALGNLVADTELRRRLGARARERIARNFSMQAYIHAHERIYMELV
ncbi:MAG: glycosyltransferase, partial [Alphaproteobacteria bacterium]